MVKNPPANNRRLGFSLGPEGPMEKEMVSNSSQYSLWEMPWTEKPGGLPSMGLQRMGQD